MTAPEKIRTNAAGNAIVTPHPVWDTDVEYIRADVAQAMVAAAYEDAARQCDKAAYSGEYPHDDAIELGCLRSRDFIRADTPAAACAALDAMLAKAREDALREAAAIVPQTIQTYGMMKPGKPDQYASREAQIVAKGFARLIEEEILALIPTAEGEA